MKNIFFTFVPAAQLFTICVGKARKSILKDESIWRDKKSEILQAFVKMTASCWERTQASKPVVEM